MSDLKWSDKEKRVAREAFGVALAAEFAELIADFKVRAAAATEPDDLWAIEEHLRQRRKEIDWQYDYRYSQLIFIFARLLRDGRIREDQLFGLSEGKLSQIRRLASPE
ncbi:hypothetical protein [Caenimonas koreensis]|uniref:hypothetical protein n=1 Tax=Caenimonas koreensis TaxID=367474 RepID=UPI003785239C